MAPANLVDSILMKEMCVYIYGTLALKKSRNNGSEGGGQCYDHNFRRFWPILCRKLAIFLKCDVTIHFCRKIAVFIVKFENF
jgi:hypothetical protein